MALPWDEVKRHMTEEFCPRNEMKKLEAEFWDLTQDSGESLAYTTRFHELSLLVPHMVTPLTRDAIRLAATLTDNHVKAGTLTRKGAKKVTDPTASSEPSKEDKLKPPHYNKKHNFTFVAPVIPINQVAPLLQNQNKKPYAGNNPLCNTCNYHHFPNMPCRLCENCGRYGHVANTCQSRPPVSQIHQGNRANQQVANQVVPAITNGRACYECGNPNHFKNQCPRIANANQGGARGRAFNINANETQVNVEAVNETN
ncbi:hypothetical protein L1987_74360 [Smallanthus sonchifolius]|uniref:Uncharacterized protein n=1 Tax=Smallanthus sonchifolius TaxID=185202 RepID=A0ACB9A338_9ASTR|nr:hypothetical protein L1987_74360 [Smallanthus sonchifolius]